jgi:hypothetical protein
VAAGYSTFLGTVEALFPPQTTFEQNSSYSTEVPIVSTPAPPQPWGPFESVVDNYTYTGVVEIHEGEVDDEAYQGVEEVYGTTTSDDVYNPIEPEGGG